MTELQALQKRWKKVGGIKLVVMEHKRLPDVRLCVKQQDGELGLLDSAVRTDDAKVATLHLIADNFNNFVSCDATEPAPSPER